MKPPLRPGHEASGAAWASQHNIVLMTASLLSFHEECQRLADTLPYGAILFCLPARCSTQERALARVVTRLRGEGYVVRVVSPHERATSRP